MSNACAHAENKVVPVAAQGAQKWLRRFNPAKKERGNHEFKTSGMKKVIDIANQL